MNSITVAMEKLRATPAVSEIGCSIVPVHIFQRRGPTIVVNRIAEEVIDGFTCARLAVTCYASSFEECEKIGAAVAATFSDEEFFGIGDADDIEFEKMPSDVTGHDPNRGYLRAIEIAVKW